VTQTKSFFGFHVAFTSVKPIAYGQRGGIKTQENSSRTRLYTPITVSKCYADWYATPVQQQWRAPPSMSFVPVFMHSVFRRIRCTLQFAQTPHFDTYSSVVFQAHCQEIHEFISPSTLVVRFTNKFRGKMVGWDQIV
jgi:hypothetical protein